MSASWPAASVSWWMTRDLRDVAGRDRLGLGRADHRLAPAVADAAAGSRCRSCTAAPRRAARRGRLRRAGALPTPPLPRADCATTATAARPITSLASDRSLLSCVLLLCDRRDVASRRRPVIAPRRGARADLRSVVTSSRRSPVLAALRSMTRGDAPRVLSIGCVEQCPRAFGADDRCPGDDRRHGAALGEQLRPCAP